MINKLSEQIALSIKRANPHDTKSVPVLKFGLIMIISTSMIIFTTSVVSFLLGTLKETWIVLISFALLRMFSGGFHFKSPELCIFTTIAGAIIVPFIIIPQSWLLPVTGLTLLVLLFFAPCRIENQSRFFKPKHCLLLKALSILIVLTAYLVFNNLLLGVTFLIQALTLIPKREEVFTK